MKTIIGKLAVGISDKVLAPIMLWAAGFEKLAPGYYRRSKFLNGCKRHIAVESAADQLRAEPLRRSCFFSWY